MYPFLLLLGAIVMAAGLALLASGISVATHAFDPTNVTPAAIAVIGGCILIGLAFVVRALLRVERALVSRPMARPARPGEIPDAAGADAPLTETERIPPSAKSKTPPFPQPPASFPLTAAAEDAPSEAARAANLQATENPALVEETDLPLLAKSAVRAEEAGREAKPPAAPASRTNGAYPPKISSLEPGLSGHPVSRQQQSKSSIFDALWPKAQPAAQDINTAPEMLQSTTLETPQQAAASAAPTAAAAASTAAQPAVTGAPLLPPVPPATTSHDATAAVSILKSGVVEGMAYTLYSDGSIEAQLPGGTVRFRSITELRNHIEQNG